MILAILVLVAVHVACTAFMFWLTSRKTWVVHAAVMVDLGGEVLYHRFDEQYAGEDDCYRQFEDWLATLEGEPYVIALNVYPL